MIKFSGWIRILITWVVITSDLLLSYLYLRNPGERLEILSLTMNFVATTAIFYIYMNIIQDSSDEESEETSKSTSSENESESIFLYKLNFGSLIEDIGVWLVLFFLLYNIVPMTLYIHTTISKSIQAVIM